MEGSASAGSAESASLDSDAEPHSGCPTPSLVADSSSSSSSTPTAQALSDRLASTAQASSLAGYGLGPELKVKSRFGRNPYTVVAGVNSGVSPRPLSRDLLPAGRGMPYSCSEGGVSTESSSSDWIGTGSITVPGSSSGSLTASKLRQLLPPISTLGGGSIAAASAGYSCSDPGCSYASDRSDAADSPLQFRVHLVTFNMADRLPAEIPDSLLELYQHGVDLYVVGTQESGPLADWEAMLRLKLPGHQYVKVASETLRAIHIAVFARRGFSDAISEVSTSSVATGIGNILGNKGGVAVSLRVAGVRLLFINAHFAAHDHKTEERNADFHRIRQELFSTARATTPTASKAGRAASPRGIWAAWAASRSSSSGGGADATAARAANTQSDAGRARTDAELHAAVEGRASSCPEMMPGARDPDLYKASLSPKSATSFTSGPLALCIPPKGDITDVHDVTFWMGDLNYRINGNRKSISFLIRSRMHEVLHANDQLRVQQRRKRVFQDFREGNIHFPPTFKFKMHTDEYSEQRIPSWTDRVLWKVHSSCTEDRCVIKQKYYTSVAEVDSSDHRPVIAGFDVLLATETYMERPVPVTKRGCTIM